MSMTAKHRYEAVLRKLKELSACGGACVEDCEQIEKKLAELADETVSIALVGAFSDGKTSVIAGLAGETLDGMEIAIDEATDGIHVYEPHAAKMPCRMVDTPGLFGEKGKEMEGGFRRFEEITHGYLKEAHVILYVVESENPLKNSHKELLWHLLRTLGKADRTIFVINRMDDVVDVTNAEAYAEMAEIKKNTVRMRLQELIGLSMEEVGRARIVCVAADPGRKGMAIWKDHRDVYAKRSHMDDLRTAVSEFLTAHSAERLLDAAALETAYTVLRENVEKVQRRCNDFERNAVPQLEESIRRQKSEKERIEKCAEQAARDCDEELADLRCALISEINGLTQENIVKFIDIRFGQMNGAIGHAFTRTLQGILKKHFSGIGAKVSPMFDRIEKEYGTQTGLYTAYVNPLREWIPCVSDTQLVERVKKMLLDGGELLGGLGVDFKIDTAVETRIADIAKFAPALTAFARAGMMVYELYSARQKREAFKAMQKELKEFVEKAIDEERGTIINGGDGFYRKYGVPLPEINQFINEGAAQLEAVKMEMNALATWKSEAEDLLRRMQTA